MARVLVVQRRLTHYRIPFFELLRSELASRGLELLLAHGAPMRKEKTKQDEGVLSWARPLKTTYLLGGRVCWQPFWSLAKTSDLVVITHENKLLFNLVMQYLSPVKRVALWGHGANLQGNSTNWKEKFKRRTARKADWWLAYSQVSFPLIQRAGFPPGRISVLDNSIDTKALAEEYAGVTAEARESLCRRLTLAGRNIGVFIGSLYSDKQISFLLEAALCLRGHISDFELLIAGDGPDRPIVETFCANNKWAHYLGVQSARGKAELLSVSKVLLNPGAVGLGLLDSFVCGVPMVTTDCGTHGPEIAYLDSTNGVMVPDNLSEFTKAAVEVMTNEHYRESLVVGCLRSATKYSLENMVDRFATGVERCLEAPKHRYLTWL